MLYDRVTDSRKSMDLDEFRYNPAYRLVWIGRLLLVAVSLVVGLVILQTLLGF